MNLHYRKEIDGLRSIAVISVVFFHAGFELFKGGFVGVDVFFVISGYLITNIILTEIINNKFSIKKFYERRARRILPALSLVMFTTIPLAFMFLTRSELSSFLKSLVATSIFFSNIFFWKEAPYFGSEAELKPLLHTWSLSIEEQFYILFPIILIFLWKLKKELIIYFLIITLVSSLLLAELASKNFPNANFYFIFTRAWELAIGATVAFYYTYKKRNNFSKNLNQSFSLIGLATIIISVFLYSNQTYFPGLYALLPTLGTALIIVFANKNTFIGKFLSNKILVTIGLMSYSFYLWHQPLFAFARAYYENINLQIKFLVILLSLFLAFFSWKFVEKIFRDSQKISSKKIFYFSLSSIIFFVIFGLTTNYYFNATSTGGSETRLAKALSNNKAVYATSMDERFFIKYRIIYNNNNPEMLVIGSSRIMQVSNNISKNKILNLGVSGASIQDHIAITEMALEKFNPKSILLGADPWLFNLNNGQYRWKSLKYEYDKSLLKINSTNYKNFNLVNNIVDNLSLWEKILENIYNLINIKQSLQIPLNIENNTKPIILQDGSRVYGKKEKINTKGRVINYSMSNYKFAEDQLKIYDNFIKHLVLHHKKKVILVLSPYQPNSYEISVKEKPIYLEIEKKFRDLAKENSIKIIGSYDPKKIGCQNKEFYSHDHPTDTCMAKVMSQLN